MSINPNKYNDVIPFKAWVQKTLPTVYDDSLSYADLLYKILSNINVLTENNNLLTTDMNKLYEYVNNYFDNLDVQEEINIKLEEMYKSGQLDELFKKYLDPKINEINKTVTTTLNQQNEDINLLTSRMDSFTKLDQGSTTGDAELIDGRIDYTGRTWPNIGDAIRGATKILDNEINCIVTRKNNEINTDSPILIYKPNTTVGPSGYQDNETYDSYYFTATTNFKIWCDDISILPYYFSITLFNGSVSSENYINRYRKYNDENTIPTASNKLSINYNTVIVITMNNSDRRIPLSTDYPILGEFLNDNIDLSNKLGDYNSLVKSVYAQKNYIFKDSQSPIEIQNIPDIVYFKGSSNINSENSLKIQPLATQPDQYDSYYFVANEGYDVYFNGIINGYMAICVGENYTTSEEEGDSITFFCKNPIRLRYSDSNLPTFEKPQHITKGSIVIFTITNGKTEVVYGFKPELALNEKFKEEIRTLKQESNLLKYSTNLLEIYLKANNGYIKYNFEYTFNETINADVWGITKATFCNNNLEDTTELTTAGEWEMAVRLNGRPDFSGGKTHGDEKITQINFFVDGIKTEKENLSNYTEFNEFKIIRNSNVYDPNNHTSIIAEHGVEYIFKNNELIINQTLLWLINDTLDTSYMAMFPVAKAVTNQMYTNNDYTISNIEFKKYADTTSVFVFDDNFGGNFSIEKYDVTSNTKELYITDNSGNPYNKMYYIAGDDGQQIRNNDKWVTTTVYKLNYNQ